MMAARSPRTRSSRRCEARSARRSPSMLDVKLYNSPEKSTWCPGCGDFGILNSVKQALAMLEIYPHECIVVSGIGCGSKLPHYIRRHDLNILDLPARAATQCPKQGTDRH